MHALPFWHTSVADNTGKASSRLWPAPQEVVAARVNPMRVVDGTFSSFTWASLADVVNGCGGMQLMVAPHSPHHKARRRT